MREKLRRLTVRVHLPHFLSCLSFFSSSFLMTTIFLGSSCLSAGGIAGVCHAQQSRAMRGATGVAVYIADAKCEVSTEGCRISWCCGLVAASSCDNCFYGKLCKSLCHRAAEQLPWHNVNSLAGNIDVLISMRWVGSGRLQLPLTASKAAHLS